MAFAQTNYPNTPLGDGSCGESIATAGCYVTTDADILTWMGYPIDPPGLNAEYLAKGLFQGGCLISPDTLPAARPDQVQLVDRVEFPGAADLSKVDNQAVGDYVALRINYPNGLPGDQAHFLPVFDYTAGGDPSTLRVCDSWDGQIKPLSRYGDPATIISAVMRYRAVVAAAAPAPTPAPPPDPVAPPAPPPAPEQPSTPAPSPLSPDPPVSQPVEPPPPVAPIKTEPTPAPAPVQDIHIHLPVGVPLPAPLPPPDEPPVVAEAGVTTTEWKLIVRYLYQLAGVGTLALITYVGTLLGYHITIPQTLMDIIVGFEVTGAVTVGSYAVSRGIRKAGTTA